MPKEISGLDKVLAYHERTKHHFQRYAAGPEGLDWANQPDPFRTFEGSPRLALPLMAHMPGLSDASVPRYADLFCPGRINPQPLTLPGIAALLELSFGLSAWKAYQGSRWALRCNPSSGNLHPTEAYVVADACQELENGVYHYLSLDHTLEQRCRFADVGTGLLPPGVFLVAMSSIHWREAWKYGERAFRYCQHDIGHAIAAVRFAAASLGWQACLLAGWSDAEITALLGLDRDTDFGAAEREHPDLVMAIMSNAADAPAITVDSQALADAARTGCWCGRANVLSSRHAFDWPVIESVAHACCKPATEDIDRPASTLPEPRPTACGESAPDIIRQRRSAQAFDGHTAISVQTFYRMLDMTLPRASVPPWDAIAWEARVHLLLFVHRVEGLVPGLYLFLRNARVEAGVRQAFSADFEWKRVDGCPDHFHLFRLGEGDARDVARLFSCHQEIAADGAFSVGMLSEYADPLAHGPWIYRHLFWEAGILGQVLYLEAEAAGVRGTGIGCFFDDAVHELVGLQGSAVQSLYHFTVGGALSDARLETLPAYEHLQRA